MCVIDDVWACVGSDNVNRRSWTNDSELSCAVLDEIRDSRPPADPGGLGDEARAYARQLRLRLGREHLDLDSDDALLDPAQAFETFECSAAALAQWSRDRTGPRPPGRLRPYRLPRLATGTLLAVLRIPQ